MLVAGNWIDDLVFTDHVAKNVKDHQNQAVEVVQDLGVKAKAIHHHGVVHIRETDDKS